MSKSGSKGMAGMVMAIPIYCVFYWTSQSHFQGACNIHARSDLIELHSLLDYYSLGLGLVLESMDYYSLVGIQLE